MALLREMTYNLRHPLVFATMSSPPCTNEMTFENIWMRGLSAHFIRHGYRFSKVSSTCVLHGQVSNEVTFENCQHVRVAAGAFHPPQVHILESPLASSFTISHNCRADLGEFGIYKKWIYNFHGYNSLKSAPTTIWNLKKEINFWFFDWLMYNFRMYKLSGKSAHSNLKFLKRRNLTVENL